MATAGFDWKCRCGQVRIEIAPGRSREITCYCNYCRHFSEEMGEADTLDAGGGVALAVLMPDRIKVIAGAGHVSPMHYTHKGAMRWYAKCCDTPIASTMATGRVPFVSIHTARLEPQAALDPPLYCANVRSATGPVAKASGFVPVLFLGMAGQVLGARISGRWRQSPFFDETGQPRATPEHWPWKPD